MYPIEYYIQPENKAKKLPPFSTLDDIERETKINAAFHKIMSTPMPDEAREKALSELLRERAALLHHTPVNGIKGGVIFFNIKQMGLAPTPLCPAYNKMRVPTVSNYGTIGSNIGIVVLDESAMKHIPKHILAKVGDLSGKQVELIWTAVEGRFLVNIKHPVNLCTHPWSHPHALYNDDVTHDVNMGVFPEVGFQAYQHPGSIAFDCMRPMEVYTHLVKGAMAFSPDNAHFQTIPGSPFGIFWSVTQKGDRIAFTKMLVIFDYNHPICKCLVKSTKECYDLGTHLEKLSKVPDAIKQTFNLPDQDLMKAFDQLPLAFQYGVYKEAWLLFDSPRGVHGDFGKASFENDSSLNAQFHCSFDQRKEAIHRFAARLKDLLYDSQIDLMLNSQTLVKGTNTLKMMECAKIFEEIEISPYESRTQYNLIKEKKQAEAMKLFEQFSDAEKQSVFLAIWELSKCPRGNDKFGTETFTNPKTEISLKAQALLLAASRQTPSFDDAPLIPQAAPVAKVVEEAPKEKVQQVVPNAPILGIDDNVETEIVNDVSAAVIAQSEELPVLEMPAAPVQMTPQDVLAAMTNLAFDDHFASLGADERKIQIKDLFNHLPIDMKNTLFGKIYEYSEDPKKGGENWGENHVADDLNVLSEALLDILG